MQLLRTPDARFVGLPGFPFAPHYLELLSRGSRIRVHYLDEGDPAGPVVVLLHGQPSWSYLYRKMIPPLASAGARVIAPDLVGFGRSDKPTSLADHTYRLHEDWLAASLFEHLGLRQITLFAQDWGGLLGLRLVAFHPERFRRVMIANTGLPPGGSDSNFTPGDEPRRWTTLLGTRIWQLFARHSPVFPVGRLAQSLASESTLSAEEVAAYVAPFPGRSYTAGPRAMPGLIPTRADSAEGQRNRLAWAQLGTFARPFRTAFSEEDPTTRMMPNLDTHFQKHVPGARGQRHVRIAGAGHFLQEDKGELVAEELLKFIAETEPIPRP